MKDDNLSFKVYKGFNNISNNIIIKIKNNYEDCFTGPFNSYQRIIYFY